MDVSEVYQKDPINGASVRYFMSYLIFASKHINLVFNWA